MSNVSNIVITNWDETLMFHFPEIDAPMTIET